MTRLPFEISQRHFHPTMMLDQCIIRTVDDGTVIGFIVQGCEEDPSDTSWYPHDANRNLIGGGFEPQPGEFESQMGAAQVVWHHYCQTIGGNR